jgi:osmoprotectant transport system permease protein
MGTDLLTHALRHALLCAYALGAAVALGVPLGVASATFRPVRSPALALAGIGRTLPSLAVLTLLLPWLGVGTKPAIVALALLAIPPLVINVDLGIRGVPEEAIDAATVLGMSRAEQFVRVVIPLALPVAIAGMRTASVEIIASATLATFIGAGGLGDDIVRALQTNDSSLLLAAAATVALLAFGAEFALARLGNAIEARA